MATTDLLSVALRASSRRAGLTRAAWSVAALCLAASSAGLLLAASVAVGEAGRAAPDLGAFVLLAWSVSFAFASATYLGSGPRSSEEGQRWRALPAPVRSRWAAAIAPSALIVLVGGAIAGPASAYVVSAVSGVGFAHSALLVLLSAFFGVAFGLALDAAVFWTHRGGVGLLFHRVAVGVGLVAAAGGLTVALRSEVTVPHPAWQLLSGGWEFLSIAGATGVLLTVLAIRCSGAAFVLPRVRQRGKPVLTRWLSRVPTWSVPYFARLLRNRLVAPYVAYLLLAGSATGLAVVQGAWGIRELAVDVWALILPLGGLALQLAVGAAGRIPYEARQLGLNHAQVLVRTAAVSMVVIGGVCAPGLALTFSVEPLAALAACGLVLANLSIALVLGRLLSPSPDRSSEVLIALGAQAGVAMACAALWSRAFQSPAMVAWAIAASGVAAVVLLVRGDGPSLPYARAKVFNDGRSR